MSTSKERIPSLTEPYGTIPNRNSRISLIEISASLEEEQVLATFDEFCSYCNYASCAICSEKFKKPQSSQPIKSDHEKESETACMGESTNDFENAMSGLQLEPTTAKLTETLANSSNAETCKEKAMLKRSKAVDELINTEKSYVDDLKLVVNGYIHEIRASKDDIPDGLKNGQYRMVFANIEAIYEWHRDYFSVALQDSLTSSTKLEALFAHSKPRLSMLYSTYCKNKPISEHMTLEHLDYFNKISAKLQCRLEISSYLIKPLQRIMKYDQLLERIHAYTKGAGLMHELPNLESAINIMKDVAKRSNKMMCLVQLNKFDGIKTGELLLDDSLLCMTHVNAKPQVMRVFLFQQCIIFSKIECPKAKIESASYICESFMHMNKVFIHEKSDNTFLLTCAPLICYTIKTQSSEQYNTWVNKIKRILQSQLDFSRALENPKGHTTNNIRTGLS